MDGFEQTFDNVERTADSTLKATKELEKLAKTLRKAAQDGNINAIKKVCSKFDPALGLLKQEVANVAESWPFEDEQEEAYFKEHYISELREMARKRGLDISERDGLLIVFPSIVRILSRDRAVRIDKSRKAIVRPSRLVDILVEQQKKPPRFRPDAFLKALYNIYLLLTKSQPPTLPGSHGPVVPLARIYEAFTSLPGSGREYSKMDFARDIYLLDDSGELSTKSGLRASFPSSTGARRSKDIFHFVNNDGQTVTYYGIQFSGGA